MRLAFPATILVIHGTVYMAFPFKGDRLIQVKITKKDKHGTATGWPRPLNRGGCLIQVPNTMFVCAKNRDLRNWPLNRGWLLNTGPLYTGSTVKFCERLLQISPRIINSLRSYIKHLKECFFWFPNTLKLVKKSWLCLVFPTYFSVFGNWRKHSSLCLIYYLNRGWLQQ